MLEELQVENLGVIETAKICFGPGLNVLTGEAGAGKTLVVEALGLLTGNRSDTGAIGPQSNEAVMVARFSELDPSRHRNLEIYLDDEELVVTRVLHSSGRSRAYINGRAVSLSELKEIGNELLVINGQGGASGLLLPAAQLVALDRFGGQKIRPLLREYSLAYQSLEQARVLLERLGGDPRETARELDLLRYQVNEIDNAGVVPGEDRELLQEAERLSAAEEIRAVAAKGREALESAGDSVASFIPALVNIKDKDEQLRVLLERAEALLAELRELGGDVRHYAESVDDDPDRLRVINERLEVLSALKRKYGPDLEDVIKYCETSRQQLSELENLEVRRSEAQVELESALELTSEVASRLTRARSAVANELAMTVRSHLSELELANSQFDVLLESRSPADSRGLRSSGLDSVSFLFDADSKMEPRPLAKVASGGELSRVMLALELAISAEKSSKTLVFDEIDSGIGGVTGIAVGEKLSALADDVQVICVTHLAQVASRAEQHFVVRKVDGHAQISQLDSSAQREEISRMLAGTPASKHALKHASELVEEAARSRRVRRASIEARGR